MISKFEEFSYDCPTESMSNEELLNRNITLVQISEHNRQRKSSVWCPVNGNVYDVCAMYSILSVEVQNAFLKRFPNKEVGNILTKIVSSPSRFLYLLSACKALNVDKYVVEEAKEKSFIGRVKYLSDYERTKDISCHMTYVKEGLNDVLDKKSGIDREYLLASLEVWNHCPANCLLKRQTSHYNFADTPFELPQGCNKEGLRSFLYEDYPLSWSIVNASRTDPGRDVYHRESLSLADISKHNAKYREYALWIPVGDQVYDVTGIYASLCRIIKEKYMRLGLENKFCNRNRNRNRNRKMKGGDQGVTGPHIFVECRILKLGTRTLERAKEFHRVGQLKKDAFKECEEDLKRETTLAIAGIQDRLENYDVPGRSGDYIRNYLSDTLKTFRNIVLYQSSILHREHSQVGDLNDAKFYVPPWFDAHALRSFLTSDYTPFDTTWDPPEERDGSDVWTPCVVDTHSLLTLYVKEWLNSWEVFDTSIDGDVAWPVIDTDIIRNDIPTAAQLQLIESRKKRTDLNNERRKSHRRRQLAKYFASKYDSTYTHVLKHVIAWTETLEESKKTFMMIVADPNLVIDRTADLACIRPVPNPSVYTAGMKKKMKQRRDAIAAHFETKYKLRHHRLQVENKSYPQRVDKWNECLEEHTKIFLGLCVK